MSMSVEKVRSVFEGVRERIAGQSLHWACAHAGRHISGPACESGWARFSADPLGNDGDAFIEWCDQVRMTAEAIRAKARG